MREWKRKCAEGKKVKRNEKEIGQDRQSEREKTGQKKQERWSSGEDAKQKELKR